MIEKAFTTRMQMSGITYHNIWYKADVVITLPNDPMPVGWNILRRRLRKVVQNLLHREYLMDLFNNALKQKKFDYATKKLWEAQNINQTWQRERWNLEGEGIRFKRIIVRSPNLEVAAWKPVFTKELYW